MTLGAEGKEVEEEVGHTAAPWVLDPRGLPPTPALYSQAWGQQQDSGQQGQRT